MIPMFETIFECSRAEEEFDPKMLDQRGGNRAVVIATESPEAQLLADGIESGLSIKKTWQNINWHLKESGQEMISLSSVYQGMRRLKPKIHLIQKRKQGSTDPKSAWSRARKDYCTQLLVRLGDTSIIDSLPRPIERRFDRDALGHLDLHQIVWWDETHRKCLIGGLSASKDYHITFPRDRNGNIDVVRGEYSKKKVSRLNVKYEKEARMGLGCAMVAPLDPNGNSLPSEGRRCALFDYSEKVLISIADYKKNMQIEFSRVRKSSANSQWVSRTSDPDTIYKNECVTKLKKMW